MRCVLGRGQGDRNGGGLELTKHTPGPWKAEKSGIYSDQSLVVAMRHPQEENHEKWKANARLIAEAPSLLEELTNIVDILKEMGLASMPGDTHFDLRDAVLVARTVLSNATGVE